MEINAIKDCRFQRSMAFFKFGRGLNIIFLKPLLTYKKYGRVVNES